MPSRTGRLKQNVWEKKKVPFKWKPKVSREAILVADKIDFKATSVTTNKKLLCNDKVINYSRKYTISK